MHQRTDPYHNPRQQGGHGPNIQTQQHLHLEKKVKAQEEWGTVLDDCQTEQKNYLYCSPSALTKEQVNTKVKVGNACNQL